MKGTDSDAVARCVDLVNRTVMEIEVLSASPKSRQRPYDQRTRAGYREAIRWLKRLAGQMQGLPDAPVVETKPDAKRLAEAVSLLGELRPIVNHMKKSSWRATTLAKIDMLVGKD